MDFESCYRAGYVMKRHGLKGDVKVYFDEAIPETLESIFIELNGRLVPFFVDRVSTGKSSCILKLNEVDTPDAADQLLRKSIFLALDQKPEVEAGKDYDEYIGYHVFQDGLELGPVTGAMPHAMNPLLMVQHEGKEILIPINDQFIKAVKADDHTIQVELPDGFLEI